MAGKVKFTNAARVLAFYSHTRPFSAMGSEAAQHWENVGVKASVFSNLWWAEIEVDGERYGCTETYFQVQKYDKGNREFLMRLTTGNDVASFGQRRMRIAQKHLQLIARLKEEDLPHPQLKKSDGSYAEYRKGDRVNPERIQASAEEWDSIKMGVMYRALHAKFTQHRDLQATLLSTGDAFLVEHTKNDFQWADGGSGGGNNYLGKMLVILREALRSGEATPELAMTDELRSHFAMPMNEILEY